MFNEESGSSLDGEIGFSDAIADAANAIFESFNSPSPSASTSITHKILSATNLSVDSLGEANKDEKEQACAMKDFSEVKSDHTSKDICDIFLPSCIKVNSILTQRGMTPLMLSSADIDMEKRSVSVFVLDAWAESIVSALEEILERVDLQNTATSEASFSSHSADASREALHKHIRDLQKKLEIAERKVSVQSREAEVLEESFEKSEISLKTSERQFTKKIKDLENVVRESERKLKKANVENERMREKLQQLAAKDREARERYNDVLSGSSVASIVKGVHVTPKSKSKKAPKRIPPSPEEVVKALDSEKMELEQHNTELRGQVRQLTESIRQLHNERLTDPQRSYQNEESSTDTGSIVSVEEPGDYFNFSGDREERNVPGSMKVLFGKIKDQQRRLEQLVHREGVLEAENRRCEEALDVYRQRSSEMMEEIENLRIELDGRPSMRAFAQKQKEVTELESKLHDVIMMRKEAAEVASFKKYLSTGDRIKADKRNHQLGLWIIESIPTAVVKEVLQSACRELDISDISLLQSSIAKLKSVVSTVPRIEAFVTQLCSYVFDRQKPTYPEGDIREEPTIEDVLPIIKK